MKVGSLGSDSSLNPHPCYFAAGRMEEGGPTLGLQLILFPCLNTRMHTRTPLEPVVKKENFLVRLFHHEQL